eukprot:SAG31_NODE_5849_length_2297_cov_1.282530_1_plen_83_part_00
MPKQKKSGPPVILSDEQRLEIMEAFTLFGGDVESAKPTVSIADLLVTMRAMGFEPSKDDLAKMVVAAGGDRQATAVCWIWSY